MNGRAPVDEHPMDRAPNLGRHRVHVHRPLIARHRQEIVGRGKGDGVDLRAVRAATKLVQQRSLGVAAAARVLNLNKGTRLRPNFFNYVSNCFEPSSLSSAIADQPMCSTWRVAVHARS